MAKDGNHALNMSIEQMVREQHSQRRNRAKAASVTRSQGAERVSMSATPKGYATIGSLLTPDDWKYIKAACA